jgi:hypothetical protein
MFSTINTEQANSRTSTAVRMVLVKTRVVRDVTPCRCVSSWRRFEPSSAYGVKGQAVGELFVCSCLIVQMKTAQSYLQTRRHVPEHLSVAASTSEPTQNQLTCDQYRRPTPSRTVSAYTGSLSQHSAFHYYPRPVHYPNTLHFPQTPKQTRPRPLPSTLLPLYC